MKHDRLNIYQKMVNGGVPESQARVHAEVYGNMLEVMATKSDLEGKIEQTKTELEGKIDSAISGLETRLVKWMVALVLSSLATVATVGALVVAIMKFLPL